MNIKCHKILKECEKSIKLIIQLLYQILKKLLLFNVEDKTTALPQTG